jgi:hypothetical protein
MTARCQSYLSQPLVGNVKARNPKARHLSAGLMEPTARVAYGRLGPSNAPRCRALGGVMNIKQLPIAFLAVGLAFKMFLVFLWRHGGSPGVLKLLIYYDPGARYFAEGLARLFFNRGGSLSRLDRLRFSTYSSSSASVSNASYLAFCFSGYSDASEGQAAIRQYHDALDWKGRHISKALVLATMNPHKNNFGFVFQNNCRPSTTSPRVTITFALVENSSEKYRHNLIGDH